MILLISVCLGRPFIPPTRTRRPTRAHLVNTLPIFFPDSDLFIIHLFIGYRLGISPTLYNEYTMRCTAKGRGEMIVSPLGEAECETASAYWKSAASAVPAVPTCSNMPSCILCHDMIKSIQEHVILYRTDRMNISSLCIVGLCPFIFDGSLKKVRFYFIICICVVLLSRPLCLLWENVKNYHVSRTCPSMYRCIINVNSMSPCVIRTDAQEK